MVPTTVRQVQSRLALHVVVIAQDDALGQSNGVFLSSVAPPVETLVAEFWN